MDQRLGAALAYPKQLALRVTLDLENGVHDAMRSEAVLGQCHAHRVDQEGHVVVDNLYHRMAVAQVVGRRRIEHADLGLAGIALICEGAIADCDGGPVLGAAQDQLFARQAGVERLCEGQRVALAIRRDGGLDSGQDGFNGNGGDGLGAHCQRNPVSWRAITRRWISLVPS